jgi:MFS family permease
MMVDRIGRRNGIILAQCLAYPMIFLHLFLPNPTIILGAILVSNIAGTIHGLSEGPMLVESTDPGKRVNVLSMVTISNLTAIILGNFLGGMLPSIINKLLNIPANTPWSFRIALLCTAFFSSIVVLLYLKLKPVQATFREKLPPSKEKNLLKRLFGNIESWPFIRKLLFGQLLIGFGAGFTVPLLQLFFIKVYNATPAQWGMITSLAKIPMILGVVFSAKVARTYGNLRTVIACQYISIPFMFLTLLAPNVAIAGVAYAVRNALMNMTGPIWSSFYMGTLKPKELSTVSSFLNIIWNSSNSTGTRFGAQLLEDNKYQWNFAITALCYLTATTFYSLKMTEYETNPKAKKLPIV